VRSVNIVTAIGGKVARSLGQKTVSESVLASELGVSLGTIASWKKMQAGRRNPHFLAFRSQISSYL
jgi:hypothetical protein